MAVVILYRLSERGVDEKQEPATEVEPFVEDAVWVQFENGEQAYLGEFEKERVEKVLFDADEGVVEVMAPGMRVVAFLTDVSGVSVAPGVKFSVKYGGEQASYTPR